METMKVESSNVKEFRYDSTLNILSIDFKGKGGISTYEYYDVPLKQWQHLHSYIGPYGSYTRKHLTGYKYKKVPRI